MFKNKSKTALQVESKRMYSYWQAMVLSFYSHSLYWDVYKRWKGIGVIYLFLMVCILSIPYGIKTTIGIKHFFTKELIEPLKRIPDIAYVNGKIDFDKKMPYFIKNEKGQIETIIDGTGKFKVFDQNKYPHLKFLFTKNEFFVYLPKPTDYIKYYVKPEKPKIIRLDIPEDNNFVFNGDYFFKYYQINTLEKIALIAIYPTIATTFFFVAIVFLLSIAMMGQVMSQTIFKVHLYYTQSCRLLFVATTPAFFVLQIMAVFEYYETAIGIVWMGILSVYFSLALIILKRNLRSIARL